MSSEQKHIRLEDLSKKILQDQHQWRGRRPNTLHTGARSIRQMQTWLSPVEAPIQKTLRVRQSVQRLPEL